MACRVLAAAFACTVTVLRLGARLPPCSVFPFSEDTGHTGPRLSLTECIRNDPIFK